MKNDLPVLLVLIGLAVLCGGLLIGGIVKDRELRAEAINAGAAEWVANKNGSVEFRWRDCGANDE